MISREARRDRTVPAEPLGGGVSPESSPSAEVRVERERADALLPAPANSKLSSRDRRALRAEAGVFLASSPTAGNGLGASSAGAAAAARADAAS